MPPGEPSRTANYGVWPGPVLLHRPASHEIDPAQSHGTSVPYPVSASRFLASQTRIHFLWELSEPTGNTELT